jgi:ADP-heptose:LPS heptosyltransferase
VILVLRALGVGDLAAAVPAVRGIRAAFPGETLALAAPTWLTPLIELVGGVDRVVATADLTARARPIEPPEIAINLHGSGPESHRLLRAADPGRLWAFASSAAGHHDGPRWLDEEHEVHRWVRLVRHYGVTADGSDLSLRVPPDEARPGLTIIHPGAKSPSRRWPPARFADVARSLAADGHHVIITGSSGETDLCVRVAGAAGLPSEAVLAGRTGLGELAAMVARARLVISGDTGIAHLATAYGRPSVVLFGPMSPSRWGPPPGRPYHRPIWHGLRAERGDAPGPGIHPALLLISVDEVLAAAGDAERASHLTPAGPRGAHRAIRSPRRG